MDCRLIRYGFPWPLEACLSFAKDKQDLYLLAEKAKKGELGGYDIWLNAEKRWKEIGISYNDFSVMSNNSLPFDKGIKNQGFPFSCCRILINSSKNTDRWNELSVIYTKLPKDKMRSWIAHNLLNNVFSPFSASKEKLNISLEKFKEVVEDSLQYKKSFFLGCLNHIEFPNESEEDCVIFFDWLSQQGCSWAISPFREIWTFSQKLANWFSLHPDKYPNLLNILVPLVLSGNECEVDNDILEKRLISSDPNAIDVAIVYLSQKKWSNTECKKCINILTKSSEDEEKKRLIVMVIRMLMQGCTSERIEYFGIQSIEVLKRLKSDVSSEIKEILVVFNTLMNKKNSGLNDDNVWKELKLPEIK